MDLSELNLEHLPVEALSLRHFCPGVLETSRGGGGLCLFLSQNAFRAWPRALLAFTNLTVLSLRSNKLEHLPSEIRLLSNLRELSVGANQLPHLPWVVEALPKLRTLSALPNPFQPAAPAGTSQCVASLKELCLRALHRQNRVPPIATEVAAAERGIHNPLKACVRAAPALADVPTELVAAAIAGRFWCVSCDQPGCTPTLTQIVHMSIRNSPKVAVQYHYCSVACWSAHEARRSATAPVSGP